MPTVRQCEVPAEVWAKLQAAAGIAATPRKRTTPEVRTRSTGRWSITLVLSCRVISEANRRDHWSVQRRRAEIQREALARAIENADLGNHTPPLPLTVTWSRTGKQSLDDDNLSRAFKSLRDALAKWLSIDDGAPCVSWRYTQATGEPGVTVTIESRPCTTH